MFVAYTKSNIIGLIDRTSAMEVQYAYDTWGKQLSVTGTLASTVGTINPFHYRAYVYDDESGLYYLQSRYYNPEWCRFINADATLNPGTGLAGINMFAYCNNNPVNMSDPSGHWPQWIKNIAKVVGSVVAQVKAVLSIPSTVVKITAASTVAVVSGKATVNDVVNDAKNYKFFNKDEKKALNAKVFSSYKGTPVLKQDISGGSMSAFNTIFLSSSTWNVETVKHEWGHTVQQSLMGTPKFLTRIAVPSLIGAGLDVDDYYSQPWERSADFFGGANNPHSNGSGFWAGLYFIMP